MTPEQRQKHLQTIEKIELMPRPRKWRETRKLLLELRPDLSTKEAEFRQACKEIRQAQTSKTAASKSLNLRNTMKIPDYVLDALRRFDPDLNEEMSGRNHGDQWRISKQLYDAFPEYRIARNW